MKFQLEHSTLATYFRDAWLASAHSAIRIAWPNEDFAPAGGETHVTFFLLTGTAERRSLGSAQWWTEFPGIIQNAVLAPIGAGTWDLNRIAGTIAEIWQTVPGKSLGYTDGVIHIEDSSPSSIQFQGAWARINVSTAYRRPHLVRSA